MRFFLKHISETNQIHHTALDACFCVTELWTAFLLTAVIKCSFLRFPLLPEDILQSLNEFDPLHMKDLQIFQMPFGITAYNLRVTNKQISKQTCPLLDLISKVGEFQPFSSLHLSTSRSCIHSWVMYFDLFFLCV